MNDAYRTNVARGAELLDRFYPGWAKAISQDELAMETCDQCILGQLYGGYWLGCREIVANLPGDFLFSSAAHGFTLPELDQKIFVDGEDVVMGRFAELAELWRDEIRKRVRVHAEVMS